MRQSAVVLAIALALALVSPALAQPFADTPTNHWAYDAIAQLAAKGLVEGYPDGTFKGDRAMTRYEMAMVVARLLARIESLQIPAPASPSRPEVTATDLDTIQRLVNEFRTELEAKNVRLAGIEEELSAMKARQDNIRLTGAYHFRYDMQRTASGAPLAGNGNPQTGSTDAGQSALGNVAKQIFKLGFDGSVTRDLHFIVALLTGTGFQAFNSSQVGFGATPAQGAFGTIDNAFLDWKNAFGSPVEIWLGRFGGTTPPGTTYPVQFGPFGLLMNTATDTWQDTTADSGANVVDGLRIAARFKDLGDLHVQGVAVRVTGGIGATTYASGEDAYGIDANLGVADGLRFGAYYVGNTIQQSGAAPFTGPASLGVLYHLYGPSGPSFNPVTGHCPVDATGIQCPALGNGYGAYVQWDIAEGIHLDGEWAQWNDSVLGGNDNGYQALVTWDLKELLNLGSPLTLATGYLHYGQNFYPPYGAADADIAMGDFLYPGNVQAFTANVTFNPTAQWTLYGTLISGSFISNGQSVSEYEAGAKWGFANNADVTFLYRNATINSVSQFQLYRAEVDYQF
ncbi:MAG TPA: S-layer homology domain-containing protein [bacterium]|nr:S-layer homology domain-containing protein [bacterium]